MNSTLRQEPTSPRIAAAIIGPATFPKLAPKPWMEMAQPRRSGNNWDSEAAEGRCHKAPGIEAKNVVINKMGKFGDMPTKANRAPAPNIHPASIIPQYRFNISTTKPPPRLTIPNPAKRKASTTDT